MGKDKIKALYPAFDNWVHNVKGYATAGGMSLILLWYEYLKGVKDETSKA